jgi:Amt family ammonium transporter
MLKVLVLACGLLLSTPLVAIAGDPTGATTGGASDIVAANPAAPTLQELAAEVGHSKVASNFVWMLQWDFLVQKKTG